MKTIEELIKSKNIPKNKDAVDVVIAYCEAQKIVVGHFLMNNKDTEYTRDRKIACYLLSVITSESQDKIGDMFNRKNHSSISRFISWVKDEYSTNEGFRKEFCTILDKLCVVLSQ